MRMIWTAEDEARWATLRTYLAGLTPEERQALAQVPVHRWAKATVDNGRGQSCLVGHVWRLQGLNPHDTFNGALVWGGVEVAFDVLCDRFGTRRIALKIRLYLGAGK